jgi:hypothetical protein
VASPSYSTFTSPPAQNALPPAPSTQNAGYFYIFGSKFARSRTICKFNEFNAFGLFSTTFGKPPFYTKSMLLCEPVEKLEAMNWLDMFNSLFENVFIIGFINKN